MADFVAPSFQLASSASTSICGNELVQLLDCLVDAEGRRLLPWRELLARLEEVRRNGLGIEDEVGPAEHPVVVGVRRDIRPFEGIGTQVEQFGYPQRRKRLGPNP